MKGCRTPEREALLRAEYPDAVDGAALLARVNALPGPPVASHEALKMWAVKLGLRKTEATIRTLRRRWQSSGGRKSMAKRPKLRTPERTALFVARYPLEGASDALIAALNGQPGPPITKRDTLLDWASTLKLRMTPEARLELLRRHAEMARSHIVQPFKPPAPPPMRKARTPRPVVVEAAPPPPVLPSEEQADAALERRHDRARRMLAAKRDAHMIASQCALPLREVFRLQGEMRMARATP